MKKNRFLAIVLIFVLLVFFQGCSVSDIKNAINSLMNSSSSSSSITISSFSDFSSSSSSSSSINSTSSSSTTTSGFSNFSSSSSSSNSSTSSASSSSSSQSGGISSSSSSQSGGATNELYTEFNNDFTYLDKFEIQKQSYNNLADKTGVCKVHFVDVGQGDCMIIELPDGKIMTIDAGDRSSEVETTIEEYIQKLNLTQIDYLLATHQDADHIGNMDAFFDNTIVKHVYRPSVLYTGTKDTSSWPTGFNVGKTNAQGGKVSTTATYHSFLNMLLAESGCTWEFFNKDTLIQGSVFVNETNKDYYFDFLTPMANVTDIAYSDANDYSPIVLFNYCGVDILFTGDAEAEVMQEYLTNYSNTYDIDVLKVGHHGSLTSTSDAYIKALKPEYCVIQVGLGNSYNHPRQEIIDILHNNNSLIYRNDTNGDIVLTICPDGTFFFETEIRDDYQRVLNGITVTD